MVYIEQSFCEDQRLLQSRKSSKEQKLVIDLENCLISINIALQLGSFRSLQKRWSSQIF